MACKSFTQEKYISCRMKWFFLPPFSSVSSFLLLTWRDSKVILSQLVYILDRRLVPSHYKCFLGWERRLGIRLRRARGLMGREAIFPSSLPKGKRKSWPDVKSCARAQCVLPRCSHFHASRMRRTVWKDLEIMEANENKRTLGGFHCFVFKFRLF